DSAHATLTVLDQVARGPVQRLRAAGARSAAAGDFDGDGLSDLAVGTNAGVLLFRGIVDPNAPSKRILAAEAAQLSSVSGLVALAAEDLDGDGDVDLAGAGANAAVLWNSGDGRFETTALESAGGASRSIAIGDVDGDALVDVVLGKARTTVV